MRFAESPVGRAAGVLLLILVTSIPAPAQEMTRVFQFEPLGHELGVSDIALITDRAEPDIVIGASLEEFGGNLRWIKIRHRPEIRGFEAVLYGAPFQSNIRRIVIADVVGDSAPEIVLGINSGEIAYVDLETGVEVGRFRSGAFGLRGLAVADVDEDAEPEIVAVYPTQTHVYSADGVLEWSVRSAGGIDVVVTQLDGDPSLEIATGAGAVIDGMTRAVEWSFPDGFGSQLDAVDLDGDGIDEIVGTNDETGVVRVFDAVGRRVLRTFSFGYRLGTVRALDANGDGSIELLVGSYQLSDIQAHDIETGDQIWRATAPTGGISAIAVGDVDRDGRLELVAASGHTSTAADILFVVDVSTREIEWQSVDLTGPFLGPEQGDLDGDGSAEIVAVSRGSNGLPSWSRALIFGGPELRLRLITPPFTGTNRAGGIALRDIDGDLDDEVVVGTSAFGEPRVEIYDYSSARDWTLVWANERGPRTTTFSAVEVADVDLDGDLEVIAGEERLSAGPALPHVRIYDLGTRREEWRSDPIQEPAFARVSQLAVDDFDGDGVPEILALVNGGELLVLDGASRAMQSVIGGPFTSLHVRRRGPNRLVVLGDEGGIAHAYSITPDGVVLKKSRAVAAGRVDGTTIVDGEALFVGSAGRLSAFEHTSSPAPFWVSQPFGTVFGAKVVYASAMRAYVTAGSQGLAGFRRED